MKQKVRVISPISSGLINLGLSIIDNALVNKIPVKDVQDDIRLLLGPIKQSVKVLADADPNNAEQVQELWLNFVRSDEFSQTTEQRILQAIDLIDDQNAKDFVSKIAKPCLGTVRSLYDANPDNVEQIRQIWTEFLTEKANIKSLLAFFIKDQDILEEVSTVVDSIHDGLADILKQL